jgi:2-C-methyl-D-erythritol 2,4-cyclodiphosphate synthase
MLRVGWGYDIHRLTPGYRLVLGGVSFPDSPAGFNTHSDGDVVAHALIDALCGALADGSLGQYFPEDAPEDRMPGALNFSVGFCRC